MGINNLKFVLEKVKSLEQKSIKNGILISGLILRGGRINENNNYLEDENLREFDCNLPIYQLTCKHKYVKTEKKSVNFLFYI